MEQARRNQMLQDPPSGFTSFNDLFAVLTHAIANPLNNISVAVQLMDQSLHDRHDRIDEPISELLRLPTEEINRLTLLLENFRSFQPHESITAGCIGGTPTRPTVQLRASADSSLAINV